MLSVYNSYVEKFSITVKIVKVTFRNEETGYSILRAKSSDYPTGITLCGNFPTLLEGETIRAYGTSTCHPQYGEQFQTIEYKIVRPSTVKRTEEYLSSGLIPGIGKNSAKQLVDAFGIEVFDIIENDPERLMECNGIGCARKEKIVKGWHIHEIMHDLANFLQSYGISPVYVQKIFHAYNRKSFSKLLDNPYLLLELTSASFEKIDKIAFELGMAKNDYRRIAAAINLILRNIVKNGHMFMLAENLLKSLRKILDIKVGRGGDVAKVLNDLKLSKRIRTVIYEGRELIYSEKTYLWEYETAELIKSFISDSDIKSDCLIPSNFKAKHNLTEKQFESVLLSLKNKILIITGGPGTGKTTLVRSIVELHKLLDKKVLITSPTGVAANRLANLTGEEASTIHRILEFSSKTGKFERNDNNKLDCDLLIIDEATMVDAFIFNAVLKAIPKKSSLVLIGDVDQLPSVGPGLVLKELIMSKRIPVTELEKNFRQIEESQIIKNATEINSGTMPELVEPDGLTVTDCYYVKATGHSKIKKMLKNIVLKSLPSRLSYNALKDIQIITPTNKGPLGTLALNPLLQSLLNPSSNSNKEINHAGRTFRVGDKVIQLKNNYYLGIFNGDIGYVIDVNEDDRDVTVMFRDNEVIISNIDLIDLAHAFAITVHKSQGSEFKTVVMILSSSHSSLLCKKLVYTAITRAKETMVFLGEKESLRKAVKVDRAFQRNTILKDLLKA